MAEDAVEDAAAGAAAHDSEASGSGSECGSDAEAVASDDELLGAAEVDDLDALDALLGVGEGTKHPAESDPEFQPLSGKRAGDGKGWGRKGVGGRGSR